LQYDKNKNLKSNPMRVTAKLIISLFMIISLVTCQLPSDRTEADVTWELISNTHADQPRARAEFTIRNNFGFRLTDRNWALYYSQTPRSNIVTDPLSLAEVEWINGDWHRIVPREGFELRRGREARISYEVSAWWIKYTDAPMGLYYIFYDDDGNETDTVVVDNFVIRPFVREEQISRHRNDLSPIPTPEWRYGENRELSLVPPAQLKQVIPTPVRINSTGARVNFTEPVDIFYQGGLENEARYLARLLSGLTGEFIQPREGTGERASSILLTRSNFSVNGTGKEAYRLDIRNNRNIIINGTDNAGVFYGIQTLLSLLPVNAFAGAVDNVTLEVMTIEDAPRFHYRGIHIDVARNFQQKETILHILDLLAFYKINTLHFHLTEDEGWRIEIGQLPELTQVGGQRQHTTIDAPAVHPAYGSGPFPYAEGTYGSGYYTREDFIEILRYATARHIRVIPEVNVPGHSRAAIKAMEARYNRFMDEGNEEAANEYRLIDPEETSVYLSAQSFTDNVINVARESAYRFFETVVDEIIDMYREADAPLEIFHTGGDEVPQGAWSESPMAGELMERIPGITEPRNLQAYFFERAIAILRERGLKAGGWEEVALLWDGEGGYAPNPQFADGTVIPYMWNSLWGHQDLAYRLANMGYPVVLCHVSNFYFDLAYNKDPREPGHTWAGFADTRDAWYYAPFDMFKTTIRDNMGRIIDVDTEYAHMERIKPEARERVLGIQAQLWSETILGRDMLEYYMLPKMIGMAESAWAAGRSFETIDDRGQREAEALRKWNIFANTLARRELPRLARLHGGYNYRLPLPGAVIENNTLRANIEFPGLDIRYTTDGQDPEINSELYTGPVEVTGQVRLRAFDAAGRSSRTVIIE
jgi:hexosaminidase